MESATRLYLNRDKDKVVEEGDPEAAFLLVGEGGEVPAEYAELYQAHATATPESKAVEQAPENKARSGRAADR